MRDDDLRALLRDSNPWWLAARSGTDPAAWAESDSALATRACFDQGYRAEVLADVAAAPIIDSLYVVRGPRRVGKSVALKDLVVDLCHRRDVSPWQIIYFPADNMAERDLRRAFALGRDLTRSVSDRPRIWLVDEITGTPSWTGVVKQLRDNTRLAHDTVILTGSSSTSASAADRDLGAGRVGTSNTRPFRLLLPMSFTEFAQLTDSALPEIEPSPPWDLQSAAVERKVTELEPYVDLLDLAWQRYLECGGFPRAVSEFTSYGAVSETFARDLAAWLRADVDPEGPQESVPLLIDALQQRMTSPLNLRAIATHLGLSRAYLDRRLNRLIHSFGILKCPQRNSDGRQIAGAQSKYYVFDPLIAQLPGLLRPGLARPEFTFLSEAVLGVTLARSVDRTTPGRLVDGDTIGYFRTDRGGEIDLCPIAVATPGGARMTTPVESKWVSSGGRAAARVIEAKYGAGVLATKNQIDTTNPAWAIPAPIVAMLLGR